MRGKNPISSKMPGATAGARFPRFHSPAVRGAAIGLVCAAVCWWLSGTSLFRGLDNWAFDEWFAVRGSRPTGAKVVIVAMDDDSLGEIEKPLMFLSPELAEVVAYLDRQGAAAIGVDFLVPGGEKTMKYLLPGGPGDAGQMGRAVGQSGKVVLPIFLAADMSPPYEWYDPNLPSAQPCADLGFVDFTVDDDSRIRRQRLRVEVEGRFIPSFAAALWIKARGLSEEWLSAPELLLDGRPVPLDADGAMRINYVGPPGSVSAVPFRDVLAASRSRDRADTKCYQDAVVLIGAVAAGYKDRYPTPYLNDSMFRLLRRGESRPAAKMMPGVEIHANALATLSDRAFIVTPWWLSAPLMLALFGAGLGALMVRCSLESGALVAVAHHLAWRAVGLAAFVYGGWRVDVVPMLVLGAILYAAIFAVRWRWIRRMMGMVKSEAVARALLGGGAKLDLGGSQREISVLFCDIRDFTPFAERHSPQETVRLLNAFFAVAVPAIEAEGGTLNQYIGDAMMVIFGAPRPQCDHAARAVRAAREIVRRVHQQADRWKSLGADDFRVGVGVHAGTAVVGTVGSPRRLDYTAIGDTVNAAARIESANKELQSEALISRAVFDALPEEEQKRIAAAGEPIALSVKGKQSAMTVYVLDVQTML